MLDARKLRMLAELDRLGTLAAVAESLQQTAPGVSMQLAALERQIGLQLTEKHGRKLLLTPAGRLLAKHGQEVVDLLEITEMEIHALREGTAGTYRIAAFPSACRTLVADVWKTVRDRPELGLTLQLLELEPQDAVVALAAGDIDLAVTHSYSNMPGPDGNGLTAALLVSENVYLATGAGGPSSAVNLADYADSDWVVPHARWTCHEMVQRACGAAGFAPRVVAETSDFAAILALVGAGSGVALIPELTIDVLPDTVTLRPLTTAVHRHDFALVREPSAADPGIHRLTDLLKTAAAERFPRYPGRANQRPARPAQSH